MISPSTITIILQYKFWQMYKNQNITLLSDQGWLWIHIFTCTKDGCNEVHHFIWWSLTDADTAVFFEKKVFLKFLQNSQKNTCAIVSFLIKLQGSGTGVSCEFSKISKNTFFIEHLRTTASALITFPFLLRTRLSRSLCQHSIILSLKF